MFPRFNPLHVFLCTATVARFPATSLPVGEDPGNEVISPRFILGGPGAVSWAGRNGATKVFKHGRKSPWVPTLTGPFPNGQANTGSWLGALYYCAQSANSFSYYLATVARFVHQAFLTRQRNYRWVEKRFGCYQQEQFNLHWENSVSDGSQCIVNNRKFKMKRRRESKKSNSLTRQNNNFARASRFVVHFFAVTAVLPCENA